MSFQDFLESLKETGSQVKKDAGDFLGDVIEGASNAGASIGDSLDRQDAKVDSYFPSQEEQKKIQEEKQKKVDDAKTFVTEGAERVGEGLIDVGSQTLENILGTFNPYDRDNFILSPPESLVGTSDSRREFLQTAHDTLPEVKEAVREYTGSDIFAGIFSGIARTGISSVGAIQGWDFAQDTLVGNRDKMKTLDEMHEKGEIDQEDYEIQRNVLYSDTLTTGGMEILMTFPAANMVSSFMAGAVESAGMTKDAEKVDQYSVGGISAILQKNGMDKKKADSYSPEIYKLALLVAGIGGQLGFGRRMGQPGTTTVQNIKYGTGDAMVNSLPQLIPLLTGLTEEEKKILEDSSPYLVTILQAAGGTGLGAMLGKSTDVSKDLDVPQKDQTNISKLEDVISDLQKSDGKPDPKQIDSVIKQIDNQQKQTKSVDAMQSYENLKSIVNDLRSGKTIADTIKEGSVINVDSIRSRVDEGKKALDGSTFAYSKTKYDKSKLGLESGLKLDPVQLTQLPSGKFGVIDGNHRIQAAKDLGIDIDAMIGDKKIKISPTKTGDIKTVAEAVKDIDKPKKNDIAKQSKKYERIIKDKTGIKDTKNLADIFADFKAGKITKGEAREGVAASEGIKESQAKELNSLLNQIRRDPIDMTEVMSMGQTIDLGDTPVGFYNDLLSDVEFTSDKHKDATIKLLDDINKGEIGLEDVSGNMKLLGLDNNTEVKVMGKVEKILKVDSEIKNNVYEKPLDARLGISQKAMQSLPVIAQTTRMGSKLFVDIQNKLNGILVDFGGKTMNFGNMLQGMQARSYFVWKSIYDTYGLGDIVAFSKNNKRQIDDLYSQLKAKNSEILDTMDGSIKRITDTVIDSHTKEHIHDRFLHDKGLKKLEYISNTINKMERFGDKNKTKEIIESLPQDSLRMVMDFTNKYDANKGGIEKAMTDNVGKSLSDTGILKYLQEDFIHGFIPREVFNKELQSDKKLRDALGSDFSYDDFLKLLQDPSLSKTQAEAIAPILKKSKNAIVYHSESPFTRIFSYAYEVSQLVSNKDIINTIIEVQQTNKDTQKFIPKDDLEMFGKELIGIRQRSKGMKIVDNSLNHLGWVIIVGSTPILISSAMTTTARVSAIGLKEGIRFHSSPSIDVRNTIKVLRDLGIEEKFITNNIISKSWDGMYSVFSGGTYDNISKAYVTNLIMRGELKRMGTDLSGVKDSEVPLKFQEELLKLPKDRQVYMTNQLAKNLFDIANFGNGSRGQIAGLNSRIFNMYKNFARTTVSRMIEYPLHTINAIYDGVKRGGFKERGLAESTAQMGTFIVADTISLWAIAQVISSMFFDEDETEKKNIFANQLMGGDFYARIGMMLINPLSFPGISITAGLIDDIGKWSVDIMNGKITEETILDTAKMSGFVRTLLPIFKDDVLTVGGKYKYSNEWTDDSFRNYATFLIGYSDGRMNSDMFKKEFDKQFDLMDGQEKTFFQKLTTGIMERMSMQGFGIDMALDTISRPFLSGEALKHNQLYQYELKSASTRNVEQIFANIKARQDDPMDAEEWIINAWSGLDIQYEDGAELNDFFVGAVKASKNEMKSIAKLVDDIGLNNNPLYRGDMNKFMSDIKNTNPDMYNKIIKTVAGAAVVRFDNQRHKVSDLVFTGQESQASFLDYMISDHFNSKLLGSELADIVSRRIPTDITDDELGMLDSLLRVSAKMPSLWDNVVDSFAVMLNDKLKNVEDIKPRIQDKQFIKELFKQGSILKGIIFRDQEGNDDINIGQKQTTPVGGDSVISDNTQPKPQDTPTIPSGQGSDSDLNDIITGIRPPQKPEGMVASTGDDEKKSPLELSDILGQIKSSSQQSPQLQTGGRVTMDEILKNIRS